MSVTLSPARVASALKLHPPTAEQAKVIGAPLTPGLVVAGAGAGKTETMAARVVWLVANGLATPERVLGLTFTRKAARQLADRVRARLWKLAHSGLLDELDPTGKRKTAVLSGEPTILTYHAYAGRLVSEHGLRIPVEPGARLLSETSSWQLAHKVVSTWAQDLDTDKTPATVTKNVLDLAGELAEHLVSAEQIQRTTASLVQLIKDAPRAPRQRDALSVKLKDIVAAQEFRLSLLPLVQEYTALKHSASALDFSDQMALSAKLVTEHEEVVAQERGRYSAILLDEYQDTGHAQRVLLRELFGLGHQAAVTAVGDPIQAIYGWRGASAANLPRFTTDFPDLEGKPSPKYGLLTSFRNPPEVLELANSVSAELAESGVDVEELRAWDGAQPADIVLSLHSDIRAEREWLAAQIATRWQDAEKPPTTAVLVRRRSDMDDIAAALRAEGLPVEVVGLGGLLDEPEVRDLVCALRILIDPLAGTAAARLLTGARWRIGAKDLAALWTRAKELSGGPDTEQADQAGLVDAIDDPGDPGQYSPAGYRRLRRLRAELAALRRRLDQALPDLIADVERTLILDVEAASRPGPVGGSHLAAFADVVARYVAATPSAQLSALLDYLDTAEKAEDGLAPGEVEVSPDRVQILTMHAAKGLEWEIVAMPHIVAGTFPGSKKSSSWLKNSTQLPAHLRGDAIDLPKLRAAAGMNRKEIEEALLEHEDDMDSRRLAEERRLCYVGLTRSERVLLASGHWWAQTGKKPHGPSEFLRQIHEMVQERAFLGRIDVWADEPEGDNPLETEEVSLVWPVDPLGERRAGMAQGAQWIRAGIEPVDPEILDEEAQTWARDVEVLLAERAAAQEQRQTVQLPERVSVSQLVELDQDKESLARKLRRPLPYPPNPTARRGTEFHKWLERRFGAQSLWDIEELPGAADETEPLGDDFLALTEAFDRSAWSDRVPYKVEVPFEMVVDGVAIAGRMDAVFRNVDGTFTVVDWKTGRVPTLEKQRSASIQLAAYRLAFAKLAGVPLDKVDACFHYVKANRTITPPELLTVDGIMRLLRTVGD